ncbi:transcriptional regulator [Rivularia sp. PCC 7116]|uniref:TetR/AcrR family transcriptional regulator n=1 Tax=Rivularia sp. PCC 7116 TaxID=373994 RepID=UPI00029EFC70|nr:TetR/AcrR family transcriptional regulator [Rivularia sp. PCC 7116]AFY58956.1 transcriptional regulator [Rivularia sp. PCC 7116]
MQKLDPQKREAILNAAKQRLRKYGIQKTKMQEIAKDAGIAVGTLYLYFKNKNDILIASIEAQAQQHIAYTQKILNSSKSPQEKLKAYIICRFRESQETRNGGSYAAELARAVIKLKPDLLKQQEISTRQNVSKILVEGIVNNIFKIDNLERDTEVFLHSIGYFFPVATTEKYFEPEEEKLIMVIDWFIEKWLD